MSEDHQLKTATGLSELWDGKRISRVRSGDGAALLYGPTGNALDGSTRGCSAATE